MKKQINIFEACTRIKIIAGQFFPISCINIEFHQSVEFGESISVLIYYSNSHSHNQLLRVDFNANEFKYGTDLIYHRILKSCTALAIELKVYTPPILVM